MSLIISNASLFLGPELEFVECGYLEIKNGRISAAGSGSYPKKARNVFDGSGFLISPAFINAHTHIADSIGKDIGIAGALNSRVHPIFGAKKRILQSPPEYLQAFIRASAISMTKKGIATFADFREGGLAGIALLKTALKDLSIKCIALGRADYHASSPSPENSLPKEAELDAQRVLESADGLGISGANENSDQMLRTYRELVGSSNKLLAVHAAESKETLEFSLSTTGKTEVERILANLKPNVIVHMTRATDSEISSIAKEGIGIIVCPRANGVLGAGVPRIGSMIEHGCTVALGTDNVMLNSPDMFREMDYAWKVTRALDGTLLEPRQILKMATVNGAKILRLNSGCIEVGRDADLIFIDKTHIDISPMHDPYAAVVHRANQDCLSAVMIGGEFARTLN